MTPLRQKMIDAMVLRGLAVRTRETYLACVCKLAKHYRCSPDTLSVEQLQAYLLYLIQERKLAYPSVNQAACAFRFLFGEVLKQRAIWLEIPMAKVPTRLPVILTRPEIVRLFDACDSLRARTILMTTYAAGLRLGEVCALQVSDIESAPERMCLKVRQAGKEHRGQHRYLHCLGRSGYCYLRLFIGHGFRVSSIARQQRPSVCALVCELACGQHHSFNRRLTSADLRMLHFVQRPPGVQAELRKQPRSPLTSTFGSMCAYLADCLTSAISVATVKA
ncbi:MAG: site-specific integrase [Rhodocyclaceae bacterium]|nr:site-specific integrase [Rhodocyclaceae bacterium]